MGEGNKDDVPQNPPAANIASLEFHFVWWIQKTALVNAYSLDNSLRQFRKVLLFQFLKQFPSRMSFYRNVTDTPTRKYDTYVLIL